jgi:hypothetical protein
MVGLALFLLIMAAVAAVVLQAQVGMAQAPLEETAGQEPLILGLLTLEAVVALHLLPEQQETVVLGEAVMGLIMLLLAVQEPQI